MDNICGIRKCRFSRSECGEDPGKSGDPAERIKDHCADFALVRGDRIGLDRPACKEAPEEQQCADQQDQQDHPHIVKRTEDCRQRGMFRVFAQKTEHRISQRLFQGNKTPVVQHPDRQGECHENNRSADCCPVPEKDGRQGKDENRDQVCQSREEVVPRVEQEKNQVQQKKEQNRAGKEPVSEELLFHFAASFSSFSVRISGSSSGGAMTFAFCSH